MANWLLGAVEQYMTINNLAKLRLDYYSLNSSFVNAMNNTDYY